MSDDAGSHVESGSHRASRILVFTATYNEASNIGEWLERVVTAMPDADVLIVDDSSPDGTAHIIREFRVEHPCVTLIEREEKSGLGSAHKLAFAYALDRRYDVLVTMDADLSHEPEQATRLIDAVDRADFVIGTRWGEGSCEYRGFRRFVSWAGNFGARLLLEAPVSEYTTSFRAFTGRALSVLVDNPPADDGYAFFMEVVIDLHRAGIVMTEVPITFRDRAGGESKIPKGQIAVSGTRLVQKAAARGRGSKRGGGA